MNKYKPDISHLSLKVDSLIFSARKTLSITVNNQGELIVRAPHKTTLHHINRFLTEKKDWIERNRQKAFEHRQELCQKMNSRSVHFLGRPYQLELIKSGLNDVQLKGETITVFAQEEILPFSVLVSWFSQQAIVIIKPFVKEYCRLLDVSCRRVSITKARTRWGSCCQKKESINFSWRLLMAPVEVVEYVVLHEVAHLKIPNHSKTFWSEVERIMPDHKKYRIWLKENSYLMNIDEQLLSRSDLG